jgi:hypothetical protein
MAEITIHADELMAALQDQHGWTEPCYYLAGRSASP